MVMLDRASEIKRGRTLSSLEALELYGCFRLSARISELKTSGHNIAMEMVKDTRTGKHWARYSLLEGQLELELKP